MTTIMNKVILRGTLIIKTAVLPIGKLSEDAQESTNKDLKTVAKISPEKVPDKITRYFL